MSLVRFVSSLHAGVEMIWLKSYLFHNTWKFPEILQDHIFPNVYCTFFCAETIFIAFSGYAERQIPP